MPASPDEIQRMQEQVQQLGRGPEPLLTLIGELDARQVEESFAQQHDDPEAER
jgi:hypothetical protein